MKRASLEPVKDGKKWRLNVPAQFSKNGRRQRLWFSTKRRADGEAEQIRSRIEKYGEIGRLLSTENLVDAAKAVALLSNHVPGTTLKAAALEYIAAHNERNASVPMAELFDAFAVAKADRSKHYLYAMRFYRQRFAPLDKLIARDLKHRKIDECGWLSFNPVTHLDEAFNKRDAVAVAALFTTNATLVAPLEIVSGRDGVEKYFADVFQRVNPSDQLTKISCVYAFGGDLCAIGPDAKLKRRCPFEWRRTR